VIAQLQHTNIVPVYSVHPASPLQIVCMPYLGDHTFEDLIRAARLRPSLPATGEELVELFRGADPDPAGPPAPPAVEHLRSLSYVDAVVWLAARLADGLAHAHALGIVHCDLKPANILMTRIGQPMLLDFGVADDTKARGGAAVAVVGGSLPYMAPEQIDAFHDAGPAVDARCDLYAFGVVLYEVLTGTYPFARPDRSQPDALRRARADRDRPPPRLRKHNPAVPPALEAIVHRCLEADPDRRYRSARDLAEDLERQRTDRPLRFAGNPSLAERARKWVRRHPRAVSATGLVVLAAAFLTGVGGAMVYRDRLAHLAARDAARATWDAFQDDARTAQFKLYTRTHEVDQLAGGIDAARAALARYGLPDRPDWDRQPAVALLPAADRRRLRDAGGDLLLLLARGLLLMPGGETDPDRLREAWRLNQLAEACSDDLAASPSLWEQRAALAAALGDDAAARAARARAAERPPHTARDHYWAASEAITAGRYRQAVPLLREATRREPQNVWAWFVRGNAHERLGQYPRAEACFDTCIALWPDFHWAYFNRGLAALRQQQWEQAEGDFDHCLRLRPDVAEAYVNRALARQGRGAFAAAADDVTAALDRGAADTRLFLLRAQLRRQAGDAAGAAADRAEGLRREPADEKSWLARGVARLADDAEGALADFRRAEQVNPRSASALKNQAHVLSERLGRPADAVTALDRAIALAPDLASAYAGRGVLHARLGHRDAAHRDAADALLRDPDPATQYQAACVFALTSRQEPADRARAFALLRAALRAGYGHDLLAKDADLDPLRGEPEYRRLTDAVATFRRGPAKH
jgi:tetratricopeptide (TPR) repeat protein